MVPTITELTPFGNLVGHILILVTSKSEFDRVPSTDN